MQNNSHGNSTTNAILVILVVVIVAFGIWYMVRGNTPEPNNGKIDVELNVPKTS